jgi:hypothetical protein
MVEEVQDHRSVEVSHAQGGGRLAWALLEVAEEQLERVPVALHGPGTGAALVDQAAQEEVLEKLVESDLGRPHDAPLGGCELKASKRPATMSISPGTAERYQLFRSRNNWYYSDSRVIPIPASLCV